MQKADTLIRTKLRLPITRPGFVSRPRLQEQIARGLRGPLTLVTAPAGFGKTTLVAACVAGCEMPGEPKVRRVWLSLDKNDNQPGRFMHYLIAALQAADPTVGSDAAQFMAATQEAPPEMVLTSLINDLDSASTEIILVLDDYQFISSQAVHEQVAFLLEHCPNTLHLLIATRSDPPLPLARLRARGQAVELRANDLRFTGPEAAQFLNNAMGLHLDARSVTALEERTEGWIAGLQMASIALQSIASQSMANQSQLSMREQKDVPRFIEGFSGTNRYILDYLLEEVLAGQPPEIQEFLLKTSILERFCAELCEEVMADQSGPSDASMSNESQNLPSLLITHHSSLSSCQSILEYLERANLFLVPLDDERQWYRYHHLFADLLRMQLQKILGDQGVARLHLRASTWHEESGIILDAIHHASLASDFERIERLIEQNYMEMMNRGEMTGIRFWVGKLSEDLIYRRPWLCLYEAFSRSWFGRIDEAILLLDEAEKRIRSEVPAYDTQTMLGYHSYIKSRVTAMQGDTPRAIALCLAARDNIPVDNLGLRIEISITLGYEYFLVGDFNHASNTLHETIRSGYTVRAINNPVAAYALLARIHVYQGRLHDAYDHFQKASQLIHEAGGQYLSATGLVEAGIADLLCEWNDVGAALVRIQQGLDFLPWWGKADDLALAYITLSRIHLAQGNRIGAAGAIEKAAQLVRTCGVFSEARSVVETAQVKFWLAQGNWLAVDHWAAALEKRFGSPDPFRYEDELAHITQARVFLAKKKPDEAVRLLTHLEESARTGGRQGRLIQILILKALALHQIGNNPQADLALAESLALAEPEGYLRIFLDEGDPLRGLLPAYLRTPAPALEDYAQRLLAAFPGETKEISRASLLIEPLTPRELEVLSLVSAGLSNRQIADTLVLSEGTVKFHVHSIFDKIGVQSRAQAIVKAKELGLIKF